MDYQRLKNEENNNSTLEWNLNREISKINYKIHTDSIKENIVPNLPNKYHNFTYADEADVLNVAMFGMTAKQWREQNQERKGNIRDNASLQQLIVLSNLESLNAEFIRMNISRNERLDRLNEIAKIQLNSLINNMNAVKQLKKSNR